MLSKRETLATLSLVLASAGIFLLALGIRTTWLPDVVPVAELGGTAVGTGAGGGVSAEGS